MVEKEEEEVEEEEELGRGCLEDVGEGLEAGALAEGVVEGLQAEAMAEDCLDLCCRGVAFRLDC